MAVIVVGASVVFFLIIGSVSSSVSRTVKTEPWPNCAQYESCTSAEKNGSLPNIVYTKASTAHDDNLHYVFSTKELPTIIIARTTRVDTDMYFDWNKILSKSGSLIGAINFTNSEALLEYKYGICFTKLIEYDDVDDDADLEECAKNENVDWKIRAFNTIEWSPQAMDGKDSFVFNTTDDGFAPYKSQNGSLRFSFRVPAKGGRDSALPSQKYSANETIFAFELDEFTPSFNHSRFALEVLAVSEGSNKKMDIETIKTIDDEYSPGVFELTNWLSNPSESSKSGFMQWKPVCYHKKDRGRKTSAIVKHYPFEHVEGASFEKILNATLLFALFGNELYDGSSDVKVMNISFGQPKDGYYVKNNYTVWTAAIGYGTPPKDEISMTVIIIISAGLGLPVLIIILGGIFTIVRKMRHQRSEYEVISDHSSINQDRPQVN